MVARKKAAKATPRKRAPRPALTEYKRKRDFDKTAEPAGKAPARKQKSGRLRFVIQKHAATHLHFDLRLELDGVMKSWAVPKGPSADPKVKRLAMQVEDHPLEYNTFEGTIPKGEYGGGTVMLWDQGTYTPDMTAETGSEEDAVRKGYERGDLKITFHGERMAGSYALVRTRGMPGGSPDRPSWLLIKHRADRHARPEGESSLVGQHVTSVTTGRAMEEIAAGRKPRARR